MPEETQQQRRERHLREIEARRNRKLPTPVPSKAEPKGTKKGDTEKGSDVK